jgi:apolipoprotein N-acyltransferase
MDITSTWLRRALMLGAGALQTLAYAPFQLWPLGILSAALGFLLLKDGTAKESLKLGWLFGFGIFGSGASWVYISIHDYGAAGVPLAIILTLLYVSFLSLFTVLQFYTYQRFKPAASGFFCALLFASVWVITDWFRSWFLTGFPWLYLGHSHIDSYLSGLAPLGGVHLLTWCAVFTGATFALLWQSKLWQSKLWQTSSALKRALIALPMIFIWVTAALLQQVSWTDEKHDAALTVAVAQGNIPQELKWDPEQRVQTILTYQALSDPYWSRDIILWPETAIPILLDQAESVVEPLSRFARENNNTLITGIPYRAPQLQNGRPVFHNSIIALGKGSGIYHKQKLVPFGEYVPLESWLRGLIGFFDLPMSSFSIGPAHQPPLQAGDFRISPFICYEIVYPEFVARAARQSELLVTISNDAWFGGSIGPHQHLEIARMRALETGRFLIRGTNSGISAIVDTKGKILSQSAQFEQASLIGTVIPASGNTPFMTLLSWPTLLLCFAMLGFARSLKIRSAAAA